MNQARRWSRRRRQKKTVRKTKEECIVERELDGEDNIYTGSVKFIKQDKGYGFINIEEDITFKDLTATKKIYVMVEDIISGSDEGLKKDDKVIFKVYKDPMGIGAMDVMLAEDEVEEEKVVKAQETKKKVTKKKTKKAATTQETKKKVTKKKTKKAKKN